MPTLHEENILRMYSYHYCNIRIISQRQYCYLLLVMTVLYEEAHVKHIHLISLTTQKIVAMDPTEVT